MRVAIAGIQGVGMAHAIACERQGYKVVAVLDQEPKAVNRLAPPWTNAWGPHAEIIHLPSSSPRFTTEPEELLKHEADLLIIATPTPTHVPLLNELGAAYHQILVEKPLGYSKDLLSVPFEIQAKTYVGHQWLFHPDFLTGWTRGRPGHFPMMVRFGHSYPPPESHKKECGVLWDLGAHALAQILALLPKRQWDEVRPTWHEVTDHLARFGLGWMTEDGRTINNGVGVEVSYRVPEERFEINELTLHHRDDLFDLQLQALEQMNHPATFEMGAQITRILSLIHPYGT